MITSDHIDIDGESIAYSFLDTGEPWSKDRSIPVVFQHGLGLNSNVWLPWLKTLSVHHPIVTIDLRGHGGSASSWTKNDYSLDDITRDITGVLDHLDIPVCHFVGESFGGTAGLHLAAKESHRFASVVACSTGIFGEWLTNVQRWLNLVVEKGIIPWSDELLEGRFFPDSVDISLVEWVEKAQQTLSPKVVAGIVRCLLGADLRPELAGLKTPLLIISPEASPYVDQRSAQALRELVPSAETVFFPDARHGVIMSHWRECSAAVMQFLARIEKRKHIL